MAWKVWVAAGLVVAAGAGYWAVRPDLDKAKAPSAGEALVDIELPGELTEMARVGEHVFAAKCSTCHGVNATGLDGAGPPLIHKIYEPSHHGDASFYRAVENGVRSHHWSFGDMAPVDGLTRGDVTAIITYIREVQRANGIS